MQEAESEVLLLLEIEHSNVTRVLDIFERELARLADGNPGDTALLQDIAAYFLGFPDECHHPKEDLILDRLAAAAPRAGERLGALKREHEEIARMTRKLVELSDRLAETPESARPAFIEQGRAFVESYRRHMEEERTAFFPEAHRVLRAADWLAIDFDLFDRPDPVFDAAAEKRFSRLRDRIERESGAPSRGDG